MSDNFVGVEYYKSQFDRIQRLIIDGQAQIDKDLTKEVIATMRQLESQIGQDLDRRLVFEDKHTNLNTLERILHVVEHGEVEATTTGVYEIDQAWRWRKGETNIWTGYGNEGKSAFLNFLTLIKCKIDKNEKAAIFSPENQPAEFFYLDFVNSILGRKPDKRDRDEVVAIYEWLEKNIFFVYPDGLFTLDKIHDEMRFLIDTKGVTTCIIDPYLKVAHDYAGLQEHHYVARFMTTIEHFARQNQVSYHVVAHQNTPYLAPDQSDFPKPNGYKIKGGGSFYDGADNVNIVWRPYRTSNYQDSTVIFESQKIKKQKLVARPNMVTMGFDFHKQRYVTQTGQDMYDLAVNNELGF